MTEGVWNMLEQRVRAGDIAGVVSLLVRIDERERKAMAKQVRALAKELEPGDWGWRDGSRSERRVDAAQAAIFGTAGPKAAREAFWFPPRDDEQRLVRARPRAWRDDWVRRECDDNDTRSWFFIRELIRSGDASRPEGEAYIATAVGGFRTANFDRDEPVRGLTDVLRLDPGFLTDDVWELFASEQAALWLAGEAADRENAQWRIALAALAADGTLSRERLLDDSLAALRRDFTPHAARWYHHFHEHLAPTVEERAARHGEYLALLSSTDTAIVGFALKALGALEKAKRLDGPALMERIGPALLVPTKGHATRAAKLAARTVKRDPALAAAAMPVFADALLHEAREVQEVAVDALERHREAIGADTAERIAELVDAVDPALRPRLRALASGDTAVEDALPPPAVVAPPPAPPPARTIDRMATPRLEHAVPLEPIASVDELLDRAAATLERAAAADEIELVVDGIVRYCRATVDPARANALLARAASPADDVWFYDARIVTAAAVVAWLDPRSRRTPVREPGSALQAVIERARATVTTIRSRAASSLLATPTHTGGWVDPRVAVDRVAALGGERPPAVELAQLVLRLPPDHREVALAAAAELPGEAGRVLRHALGGEERRRPFSTLGAAWDAAEQARDPDARLAARLPPVELVDVTTWGLKPPAPGRRAVSPADSLDTDPTTSMWVVGRSFEGLLAAVSPLNRERLYALGVNQLTAGWTDADIDELLTPLLEPTEPVGPAALRFVALAVGADAAVVRAAATDVLLAAFGDRRLDGDRLGGELAAILRRRPGAVPARWAEPLLEVAAAGHAHDAHRAAERLLGVADGEDRRRVLGLVELLRRLAIEHGLAVTDPGARAFLERLPPKSKGGRLAREALAVPARA